MYVGLGVVYCCTMCIVRAQQVSNIIIHTHDTGYCIMFVVVLPMFRYFILVMSVSGLRISYRDSNAYALII